MPGSADKLCSWPNCTEPKDEEDGVFCVKHSINWWTRRSRPPCTYPDCDLDPQKADFCDLECIDFGSWYEEYDPNEPDD